MAVARAHNHRVLSCTFFSFACQYRAQRRRHRHLQTPKSETTKEQEQKKNSHKNIMGYERMHTLHIHHSLGIGCAAARQLLDGFGVANSVVKNRIFARLFRLPFACFVAIFVGRFILFIFSCSFCSGCCSACWLWQSTSHMCFCCYCCVAGICLLTQKIKLKWVCERALCRTAGHPGAATKIRRSIVNCIYSSSSQVKANATNIVAVGGDCLNIYIT